MKQIKYGFDRLSQKQQKEYDALVKSLKDSGIASQEQARALLANIRNRSLVFGAVILAATSLAILLLPKLKGLAMLIAGLSLAWLLAVTAKGYQLIGRYIRKELQEDD